MPSSDFPIILGSNVVEKSHEHHAANIARGWWKRDKFDVTVPRNIGELLCLVHSEIDEAADSGPDEKLPHRLASEVELADAAIRLYDILGYQASVLGDTAVFPAAFTPEPSSLMSSLSSPDLSLSEALMTAHRSVSAAMEHFRKGAPTLGAHQLISTLHIIEVISDRFGWDVASAIDEKHEYNGHRPDHSLAARSRPGGKKW